MVDFEACQSCKTTKYLLFAGNAHYKEEYPPAVRPPIIPANCRTTTEGQPVNKGVKNTPKYLLSAGGDHLRQVLRRV